MKNCTYRPPPHAEDYLTNLDTTWLVLTIIAACVAVVVLAIFIEEVCFLQRKLPNWRMKNKVIFLLGLYPIFAVTSTVGLLIPRSENVDDLVCSLYLSIAVYLFVKMLIGHYGGKARMSVTLSDHEIRLRTPPLCCCIPCLPNVPVSVKALRILELMVLQYSVLKPLLLYISVIVFLDNRENIASNSSQDTAISTTNTLSTFVALWANVMLFRLSAEPLKHMSVKKKFYCIQLVLVTENLQKTILNWLALGGVITCTEQLDVTSATLRMNSILKVFEMLLISIIARSQYRRHQYEWFEDEEDDEPIDSSNDNYHSPHAPIVHVNQPQSYGAI